VKLRYANAAALPIASRARMPLRYFAALSTGKLILWCYLIWYLVVVFNYFDRSPALWLNAAGVSAVVGVALRLSVVAGRGSDRWQTFRLFLMPFCVSSFSSLIKGHGFVLIVPPRLSEQLSCFGLCAAFLLAVAGLKRGGCAASDHAVQSSTAVADDSAMDC
jgi:hypothetical protein